MSSSVPASTPGKAWQPPTPEELQPELPQYEIISLLGRGGMGAVYKARQKSLKREVAIKVLPPTIDDGGMQFAERFKAEAESMARLNHPGVVSVYDAGETPGGLLYIVMEFVEGTDVSQMIRSSGRLPPEYAYSIAAHVCDALAYAHANGLIHRDIKPANIMVDKEGRVKVADFGLAKMTNENSGFTQTNMAVGTPDFVAPEALFPGVPLDGRADLYAVGVMLYQMLTGSIPRGAFKPASVIVPGVDARYDQIVLKAMQVDREERHSSAVELRQHLDTLLVPVEAPVPNVRQQTSNAGLPQADMSGAETVLAQRPSAASVPQTRPAPQPVRGPSHTYAPPPPKSKAPLFFGIAAVAVVAVGAFVMFSGKQQEGPSESSVAEEPAAQKAASAPGTSTQVRDDPPVAISSKATVANATKDAPPSADGGINLIALVDVPRDVVAGVWTKANGELVSHHESDNKPAVIGFPVKNPPEEYDLRIRLRRKGGFLMRFYFWDGKARSAFLTDHWTGNMASKGETVPKFSGDVTPSPPRSPMLFVDGLPHELLIQVRKNSLEASYDGTSVVRREYGLARLKQDQDDPNALPFGISKHSGDLTVIRAELVPVSASAGPASNPPSAATKDAPYVNSLGMKFVPVPITGGPTNKQRVLFSVWETRVQDYEVFVKETPRDWPKPHFEQGPTHPALFVNWDDAAAFCAWLTQRERQSGKLGMTERYRLPSDHEWSCAMGIGDREDAAKLPAEKNENNANMFTWGTQWPPPAGVGNLGGEEMRPTLDQFPVFPAQPGVIVSYNDGFPKTAPAGSFRANTLGLHDLSGNAWEWCEDWFDNSHGGRVLRGGGWNNGNPPSFLSARRDVRAPTEHIDTYGFRCVLSAEPASTAAAARVVPVSSSSLPPELAALDAQFVALQKERVTVAFDADVQKLNTGYLGGIVRKMGEEKAAGHLDELLALEAEQKLLADKLPVPETDDEKTAASVKGLRVIYRDAYAKLIGQRMVNLKTLVGPLEKRLAQMEADFTKADRVADAKTVRGYRVALGESTAEIQLAAKPPMTGAATPSQNGLKPGSTLAPAATLALKNGYTNSLGMKFLPVKGVEVLFCIHETRVQDYAAYAAEVPGVNPQWKLMQKNGIPLGDKDDHPAAGVSWDEAKAFCAWLSKKEGKNYRLPTDEEWSIAVGLGSKEKWIKGSTPEMFNGKETSEYPWGGSYPPQTRDKAGNYQDTAWSEKFPAEPGMADYTDGYATTAPVMSFKPNKSGLYDMGGNVWEWVEDWYNAEQKDRVLRGGSLYLSGSEALLSSHRFSRPTTNHDAYPGFRVVLAPSGSAPATALPPSVSVPPKTTPQPINPVVTTARNNSYTNTLGMKFVPVKGLDILFCIHETRRQDYAAYAADVPDVDGGWKSQHVEGIPSGDKDDHPVVGVSWNDAHQFCAWLSQKEGKTYRIPTDEEWSAAVGLGIKEKQPKDMTPEVRCSMETPEFPWGGDFPPKTKDKAGNYSDTVWKTTFPALPFIDGYTDGYPTTSPVMSFKPGKFGLYDMGGNVWEWVEDWKNPAALFERTLRSGCFADHIRERILTSGRHFDVPTSRNAYHGFRVVLVAR